MFNVRTADLRAINSVTKYPSIPTYHNLDPANGSLLDATVQFTGTVLGTEKVDGTSARVICLPDGSWLIGSREELLHAENDVVANPSLGIVDALRPIVGRLNNVEPNEFWVFYLEVYGRRDLPAWKQYGDGKATGWRLFDVAIYPDWADVLSWPIDRIASWRQHGGQRFLTETDLLAVAANAGLDVTPRLFAATADALPTDVEKTRLFLEEHSPRTRVALGEAEPGRSEGIVFRTPDRSVIAKARFQDYDRTLRRRQGGR